MVLTPLRSVDLASRRKDSGSGGASLFVTTGTGATTANSVMELSDTAGYNIAINITTANNVTLYTGATGTLLKGIAFAPVSATATTTAVTSVSPLSPGTFQPVTFTATVTANSGPAAPAAGRCRIHRFRCQRNGAGHRRHGDHERRHLDL